MEVLSYKSKGVFLCTRVCLCAFVYPAVQQRKVNGWVLINLRGCDGAEWSAKLLNV